MDDVALFAKPDCPYCAAARDELQRRGIPYTEYNVLADHDALRQMLSMNGGVRHVPTVVEGQKVTVGFNGY